MKEKNTSMLEVITTHMNADFDALASMVAIKKLYKNAVIVFPGSQEKNLRNFFLHTSSYLFDFAKMKDIDFNAISKLILVDTRQKKRIGKFKELLERDNVEIHIYDHHPPSDDDIKGDVEVIEKAGAGTSILTKILRDKGIKISPDEATLMSLGIYEDTGSFTFSSTMAKDHEAAAWLLEQGASLNTISDMLTRELTAEQVWLLNDLMSSAVKNNINGIEIVIAKVKNEKYIGDFAVLVQKFMEMENLNVIFALAQMANRVYMVARSRVAEVNAAEIAVEFNGGGHPQAASATISDKTIIQVEEKLKECLLSRVNFERLAKDIMTSPAIHISSDSLISDARRLLTIYNINVLIVIDKEKKAEGYISNQVIDRAISLGLETRPVKEYMNLEFYYVGPSATLSEIQDLIINNNVRILPVLRNNDLIGVITRTDLLNILIERSSKPEFLYDSENVPRFVRKKNIKNMFNERLPAHVVKLLKDLGEVADESGFNAYLVGGLVRDIILKRENLDVDIVIEGDGIQFAKTFASKHKAKVKSHAKFGTANVSMPDGFKLDIATARMERYESPGALPLVELSSLKRDLLRRDFTINTLAVYLNKKDFGVLIDHFGALKDIKERVLRVIHNLSFIEDPTRILRALRFEQRFEFKIGKLTETLIQNAIKINCFKNLSSQRLFAELRLILMEEEPAKIIQRMDDYDILKFISPKLTLTNEIKNILIRIKGILVWFDLLYLTINYEPWKIYFLGLTHSLPDDALHKLARWGKAHNKEIISLVAARHETRQALKELYRVREGKNYSIYRILSPLSPEMMLYAMAITRSEKIKRYISIFFTKLRDTKVLLHGNDLIAMGYKPGAHFKTIFDSLLKARLENNLVSKEDEIAFLKKNFTATSNT
jgi:tRNA nucleotidyltransferase (CCA-adding enzyme)